MIFRKFENLLKTISDDSIQHPKGHPSIPGKSQNFHFFVFGNIICNIYIYIHTHIYIYIYIYIYYSTYNGQNQKMKILTFSRN